MKVGRGEGGAVVVEALEAISRASGGSDTCRRWSRLYESIELL